MGKQKQLQPQHLELKGQEIQQQDNFMMADEIGEEIKRKNSADSALKSVKSASINVIKKGIKMGTTGFQTAKKSQQQQNLVKPNSNLSPDMFDYSKGEASALGFEPLAAQTEKPEITIVRLSEYTQKEIEDHQHHPPLPSEDQKASPSGFFEAFLTLFQFRVNWPLETLFTQLST